MRAAVFRSASQRYSPYRKDIRGCSEAMTFDVIAREILLFSPAYRMKKQFWFHTAKKKGIGFYGESEKQCVFLSILRV